MSFSRCQTNPQGSASFPSLAPRSAGSSPRSACFNSRFTLETEPPCETCPCICNIPSMSNFLEVVKVILGRLGGKWTEIILCGTGAIREFPLRGTNAPAPGQIPKFLVKKGNSHERGLIWPTCIIWCRWRYQQTSSVPARWDHRDCWSCQVETRVVQPTALVLPLAF